MNIYTQRFRAKCARNDRTVDYTLTVEASGSLSRFGMYPPPTAAQRAAVIAEIIESHNSAAVWIPQGEQQPMLLEIA